MNPRAINSGTSWDLNPRQSEYYWGALSTDRATGQVAEEWKQVCI